VFVVLLPVFTSYGIGDTALIICGPDYMKRATAEQQVVIAEAQDLTARVLVQYWWWHKLVTRT
jgi:hypothetical protein